MYIDFTGRQVEISPDLRRYTQERLRKIVRLLGEQFGLHVILTAEKHRRIAELTLKFHDRTVVGVEETGDIRISINGAIESWPARRCACWSAAAPASAAPNRLPRSSSTSWGPGGWIMMSTAPFSPNASR